MHFVKPRLQLGTASRISSLRNPGRRHRGCRPGTYLRSDDAVVTYLSTAGAGYLGGCLPKDAA